MTSLPAGFEPTRGNPIGFQVQRLNHSATTAGEIHCTFKRVTQMSLADFVAISSEIFHRKQNKFLKSLALC